MNSYTKLRDGTWGVRCDGKMTAGTYIQVTTKAGAIKRERIDKVLWTGPDSRTKQTVSLCSVQASESDRGGRGKGKRNGCSCGAIEYEDGSISDNACWQCKHDAS